MYVLLISVRVRVSVVDYGNVRLSLIHYISLRCLGMVFFSLSTCTLYTPFRHTLHLYNR
jgi:hypothetical protein